MRIQYPKAMTRQKSLSEALDDSIFPGVSTPKGIAEPVRKFLRSILKFQLFSPYKPTGTFVSAGLQFGLERDAKHHRGMPSGAGRLPG